ncbi:MAG: peptidoglycan DD-metalloendopeptidase family protein [Coriobacteriia bacterium]|nr:peptidoglycan DD-metalloendopeptidase family protein [Coriobacteriia bacterium]MCL2537418.1 peptidoglycan DD-metalloendopeptidase family protein [Coriobacteriia bacterium]
MRQRYRASLAGLMVALMLAGSLSGLFAVPAQVAVANPSRSGSAADHRERAQDARDRAAAADRRAEELQREIRNLDASIDQYSEQAAQLAPQVQAATARTTALTGEVNALQADVDELTADIAATEEELAHQQGLLNARAVSTYRGENNALLAVLFGARDLGDLIARAENIMVVLDHNSQISIDLQALTRRLENEKNRLDTALTEVSARRSEAADAEAELRTLQQRAQTAADTASRLQRERSGMLADTQANAARLRALADEEDAMAAQIARQLAAGGGLGGSTGAGVFQGRMTWPVPGFTRVTSGFGMRTHPIFGGQRMHTGVDIAGAGINGAAVVAAGNGRVISVGWRGGYGNTIIIDHGDGVTTLYAHLQGNMQVSVGQTVTAGQRIASVGSTGNSTGPHLHWEVRVNGQPRNPMTF